MAAGEARLSAPLTPEYVEVAINLLKALRQSMEEASEKEKGTAQG